MATQAKDKRSFDDDGYIDVNDARESENVSEELNRIDGNVETNEQDVTTDMAVRSSPKLSSESSESSHTSEVEDSDSSPEELEDDDINTRYLAAYEPTYKLETFEYNAMIIFNQYVVQGQERPRVGTKKDGKRIKKMLQRFGFRGKEHMNLTKQEIFKELDKFSSMDFNDYGCVAIVVMTYGVEDGLLMAKDDKYSEQEILQYFKNRGKPKLITKPVVVIIQACRGFLDVEAPETGRQFPGVETDVENNENVASYHLPVEADTIVVHSSYISKSSDREEDGTWFIKSLCKNIDSLSLTHDFESIIIEVKREVGIVKNNRGNRANYTMNKHMPVVTSALMRKLYLRKYGDEPPIIQQIDATEPHMFQHCIDDVPGVHCLPEYQYMRDILQRYAASEHDLTAEYLLRCSAMNLTKCDTDILKITLVAMSNFIKDRFRNTLHHDYIYYYEIE